MCERVSFLVTTEGPLQLLFAPGLRSHAAAREGWKMTSDGAEAEWTGENHNSLTIRHKDAATAATVKQMIIDRYANRSALLTTIGETRGPNGFVVSYRGGKPILPNDRVWRMDLEIGDEDTTDFSDIVEVLGDVTVNGTFTAPVLAKAGDVTVYGNGTFTAPVLAKGNEK